MIQGHVGESCDGQSRGKRVRLDRHKRAVGVNDAVEPPIWNFKGKKAAAWLQHAANFREGAILELARAQVMQREDGDGRGEGAVGKGQCGCVALHDAGAVSMLSRKPYSECMVVFEAGYARNAISQLGSGGTWASANFEKVIAQIGTA